jgi:hypothetical protein
MKPSRIASAALLAIMAVSTTMTGAGCASSGGAFEPSAMLPLATAAGAGVIGYELTDGEDQDKQMLVTAGSAAAGYIVAEFLRGKFRNDLVDEFNAGYSLGISNAAKQNYWIMQNRQAEDDAWGKDDTRYRTYAFPGAEYDPSGAKLVEHDVVVRSVE